MKAIFTLSISFLFCSFFLQAQFSIHHYLTDYDMNHYSIETSYQDETYVLLGTLFDKNGGGNHLHIIKIDFFGNKLWEKILDRTIDDRGFDLTIGPDTDIVITGYMSRDQDALYPKVYVGKLDVNGNVLYEKRVILKNKFWHGVGTNVIYSLSTDSYIIGGLLQYGARPNNYIDLSVPLKRNQAFVMSLRQDISSFNWKTQLFSAEQQHTSINDIVEIADEQILVLGSTSFKVPCNSANLTYQGVLAATIDLHTGTLINNYSFKLSSIDCFALGNQVHSGASAVYFEDTDEAWIMSNPGWTHHPILNKIENVSQASGQLLAGHSLTLNGSYETTGFKLLKGSQDGTLLALGHIVSGSNISPGPSTPMFATLIDYPQLTNNSIFKSFYWTAPSPNFGGHGGGLFSTVPTPGYTPHTYIFNQEIATNNIYSTDLFDFTVIAPHTSGNNFGIDVIQNPKDHADCIVQETTIANDIAHDPISLVAQNIFQGRIVNRFTHEWDPGVPFTQWCNVSYLNQSNQDDLNQKSKIKTEQNVLIFPNPSSGLINIQLHNSIKVGILEILNLSGQTIHAQNLVEGKHLIKVDFKDKPMGVYYVKINTPTETIIEKIIIQ
jgi:hypothetical protein